MFETIINEAQEKFNLGDKAGNLLAALLGLIADPANGGFSGFVGKFRSAGLGGLVDSWIATGDNEPVSNEQLKSALGEETINSVAEQAGFNKAVAVSALSFMTPRVVDALTPAGEIPDDESLFSKINGFLKAYGGPVAAAVLGGLGTIGALAGGAADKVAGAAGSTIDAGRAAFDKGADTLGDAASATFGAGKRAAKDTK